MKKTKHHRQRLSQEQIKESERLRLLALSSGWTKEELAKICNCHPDTIKQFLEGRQWLSQERQVLLRTQWSAETGGPG